MNAKTIIEQLRFLGPGSIIVIIVTMALFSVAIVTKGFTYDLLLETAIFLVSVKLIIMTYRNGVGVGEIQKRLDMILTEEKHLEAMLAALQSVREESGQ